jgi:tetratricopeptide (TPR) repeat protein
MTRLLASVLLAAWLAPAPAFAQSCTDWVAIIVSAQGNVESRRSGQTQWARATLGERLCHGDAIRVQAHSRAGIVLRNEALLRLDQNTTVTFPGPPEARGSWVEMLRGAIHFISRMPRGLKVLTPFVNGTVEGTEFWVQVFVDETIMAVLDGRIHAENADGRVMLGTGQSAIAHAGRAPREVAIAKPRDAVQWALYYSPVLYLRPDEFPPGPDWRGMVRQSLEFYRTGDLQKAFDSIAAVPPTVPDSRFFAYRGHLLLAVGRADEAAADIERVLRLTPDNADALALQTIIAVTQGDRDGALASAQRAVQAAPNSATAYVALSYTQQARFDLDGAQASLETAIARDPRNALAWARLSELQASFGELSSALQAAEKAAALDPNLARPQTVLGYAYLMQVKTKRAKEAFAKAIALDSADPLPRLGLGLAKIREGALHDGSRDIEVAASLDPGNSIVRSYLGKAYYEEKRQGPDEREYAVAKQLDPNDPTPHFYDAIAKQTTNRPVEALRDMQRAIELNDNRAVYRSRLLLDSDLAARSAAQARVYSDLGFQQLALVEGWKSVNTDPGNFSAHRFLADSYAAQPRHQIARVSELLQSQLLQPSNNTPIQPRLAESNLFLISASGPGALSFNEFNPIFNRNGVSLLTTGLGGSNDTWGGEAVLAGIFQKLSLSLGYTYFNTAGWRDNAGQKDQIGNAFVQWELSPQTSVQAEYRYRERENGALPFQFFTEDTSPHLRETEERSTYRVGLRHALTSSSIVLASLVYQNADFRVRDRIDFGDAADRIEIDLRAPGVRGIGGELQYLYQSREVNLVGGAGYFDFDSEVTTTIDIFFPPFSDSLTVTESEDGRHGNAYLYSYWNRIKGLTVTLGVSVDVFRTASSASEDRDQPNPKFGVTWNPLRNTTIRAAAFRVLTRTLINGQTIEPTQVAGFTQFFDDISATDSWRYGVAIDQKFSNAFFGGAEASRRNLRIPVLTIPVGSDAGVLERGDATEDLIRAYLFWTPHPWLALSAEYQYERFDNDEEVGFFFTKVTTHRVPLGLRFFHPSGFSAALKTTYYHQDGEFLRQATGVSESEKDDFWLVDAAVSYRLPQRFGLVTIGVTNLFNTHRR